MRLADPGKVSASTQNQALAALLSLYQVVLGRQLAWLGNLVHAKRPVRLPVVLTRAESRALRLLQALQLRIKDIDLERREVLVRAGKGRKDRLTVVPEILI